MFKKKKRRDNKWNKNLINWINIISSLMQWSDVGQKEGVGVQCRECCRGLMSSVVVLVVATAL